MILKVAAVFKWQRGVELVTDDGDEGSLSGKDMGDEGPGGIILILFILLYLSTFIPVTLSYFSHFNTFMLSLILK